MKTTLRIVLVLGVGAWCSATFGAQGTGSRPVRLLVTSVAGGPSDFVARMIAPSLGEALGRNVVVDARGSVGGILAAEIAAKATPDGSTLIVGNTPEQFAAVVKHDTEKYRKIVAEAGIRVQ